MRKTTINRVSSLALIGLSSLVLSACTSDDDSLTESVSQEALSTPEARAYLDAVDDIQARVDEEGFENVDEALTRVYPTRGAQFAALRELGYEQVATTALRLGESLDPPGDLAFDHQSWILHRRLAVDKAFELTSAVEMSDLQMVVEVLGDLAADWGRVLTTTSREFCLTITHTPDVCPPPPDLPGGEYGRRVYEILRSGWVGSLGLFFFPLDMTPEELAERLETVQPRIEINLLSTAEALESLDPPPEFLEQHEELIGFFRSQYELAVEITAANRERELASISSLFDQSVSNQREARESIRLSADFARIAGPFFVDPP